MIFGRPVNLVVGAFQAVLGAVVLALGALDPPVVIPAAVVAGVVIAFGAVIALVANQPPTVNAGDQVNVITPQGQPNTTITAVAPSTPPPPTQGG